MSNEREIGERILATLLYVLKQKFPPSSNFAEGFYETLQGWLAPVAPEAPAEVSEEATIGADAEVETDADADEEVDEEADDEEARTLLTSGQQDVSEPTDEEAARVFLNAARMFLDSIRALLPHALALSHLSDVPPNDGSPLIACWQLRSRRDVHVLAELIFNRRLLEVSAATYQNFDVALVTLLRRNPPPVWKPKKKEKAKKKKGDERMRLKKLLLKQGRRYVSLPQFAEWQLAMPPERSDGTPIIGLGAHRAGGVSLLSYRLHAVLLFASMPANALASFDNALNAYLEKKIQPEELRDPDAHLSPLLNYLRRRYWRVFKDYQHKHSAANAQMPHPIDPNEGGQFYKHGMDITVDSNSIIVNPPIEQRKTLLPVTDPEMRAYLARLREIVDFIEGEKNFVEKEKNRLPFVEGTPFPLYFRLHLARLTLEIVGGQKYWAQAQLQEALGREDLLKALDLTFRLTRDPDICHALRSIHRNRYPRHLFGALFRDELARILDNSRFDWREEGIPDMVGTQQSPWKEVVSAKETEENTRVLSLVIEQVRKGYESSGIQRAVPILEKLNRLAVLEESQLDIEQSITLWSDLSWLTKDKEWKKIFGDLNLEEEDLKYCHRYIEDLLESRQAYLSTVQDLLVEKKPNIVLAIECLMEKYLIPTINRDREHYTAFVSSVEKKHKVKNYTPDEVRLEEKWLRATLAVLLEFRAAIPQEDEGGAELLGRLLARARVPSFSDRSEGLPSKEKLRGFLKGNTDDPKKSTFNEDQRHYLLAALMLEEPPQPGPFLDHFAHYRNIYLRVVKDLPLQSKPSEYHKWLRALYDHLAPTLNNKSFTGQLQKIA